jgi:tetratricopeptide (TPR) repeat protein
MRPAAATLGLLIGAVCVGAGFYWLQSGHRLEQEIAQARAAVGTRRGQALIERLAAENPGSAEVQFLSARQLDYDGKPELAEACLNKASALGWPKDQVERQRWIAVSQKDLKDFARAEPRLLEFLDTNANDREVILALASGYNRFKQPHRAESLLNRLLEADPNDGPALTIRGSVRLQLMQADQALPDLEKAYAQSQDRYYRNRAQVLFADCLRTLGQIDKAIVLYRDSCEKLPADAAARYNLGLCAHYLGQSDEALAAFSEVLRLKPGDMDALLQIAYIHDERRELNEALDVLHQIEVVYPDEPQMLVQMAKTYQARGDVEKAARYRKRFEDVKHEFEQRMAEGRQKKKELDTRSQQSGIRSQGSGVRGQ